jgi:hypothetical protein
VTIYNLHFKGARNFNLLRNVQTVSWAHPAFYSRILEFFFLGSKRSLVLSFTSQLHPTLWLKMRGVLLPLHYTPLLTAEGHFFLLKKIWNVNFEV